MSDSDSEPDLLNELANDFAERYRRGERPGLSEYTARYPELAHEIRDLFPAMAVIEQLGSAGGGPPPQSATPDGPAPRQLGEYRILREVARGGMGIVYEAVQESLGRHVALKVLPFQSLADACQLERFRREARAAAMLHHTNIVPVFGVGAHEGVHYFAMQFIRGQALSSILHELRGRRQPGSSDPGSVAATPAPAPEGPLTVTLAGAMMTGQFAGNAEAARPVPGAFDGPSARPASSTTEVFGPLSQWESRSDLPYFRSVARVGLQVVEAIAYAHGQGVLHRDIKPANILLDTEGTAWVTDFGLAKAGGSVDLTGPDDLVGTLRYMAPERFRGESGPRSDVFSLGLTLYEMATLRPAFGAPERAQLIARMLHDEPPRPRTIDRRIPHDLETLILKAIAKEPARRYQTAGELAEDLRRFLADRPVRARRTGWPEQFGRWCRRNPAIAGLSATAAALLVAAVTVLAVSNARISLEAGRRANALAAAKTSEQEAVQNLKAALMAVDRMLTRVSEERLPEIPQMEPVRRELLQDALTFYESFFARRSDDPAVRRETALAHSNMGSLHFRLGVYDKSEAAYRKAFALLDELNAASPLGPNERDKLIGTHLGFAAVLQNQGKFGEEEDALRHAVALAEQLYEEFPEVSWYRNRVLDTSNHLAGAVGSKKPNEAERILRRNLALTEGMDGHWDRARSYERLGHLLAQQRRFTEAEAACRQGVRSFEKALAEFPSARGLRGDLADTLVQLAKIAEANGRVQEAEALYQRALPIIDAYAADFPAGPHGRWGQAKMRFEHASLLRKLGRQSEVERAFRQSVELFDSLAADFPALPGYMATAVYYHHVFALFLAGMDRPNEARSVYDRAAQSLTTLPPCQKSEALARRGEFHAKLGEWHAKHGEWREAADDFAHALEDRPEDATVRHRHALAVAAAGDLDGYRRACASALARFAGFDNRYANEVARACVLAPSGVDDFAVPLKLAEEAVHRSPKVPRCLYVLGLAHYRAAHYDEAVRRLNESIQAEPSWGAKALNWPVLAMAQWRLGHEADARRWLGLCRPATGEVARGVPPGEAIASSWLCWWDRTEFQLLRREAEALILDSSFPADPFAR